MRIVLIKGASQYDGTRTFIDHAAAAFEARGFKARIVDIADSPNYLIDLAAAAAEGPTHLVFSIAIMGEARDGLGRTVGQMFGAPHVVWHCDYLLNMMHRLKSTPPEVGLLTVDPTQAEALQSIYGAARYPNLAFMPHAAIGEAAPDEDAEAYAARPIPLLWCGSIAAPGAAWAGAPAETRKVFDDAFDLALSVEWMPAHEAFDRVLAARGLDLDSPASQEARASATTLDTQVRLTRRFEFVKALAKTGLPVTICGAGWDKHLYRFKRATYEGAVPMTRAAELMRESRIVLHTNGNFGAGGHERPLSALLAGALPVSDHSRFWEAEFGDGDGIALYRWKDLKGGMDRIAALLGAPAEAHAIAARGKAKVLAGHTWAHRVDDILAAAERSREKVAAAA